MRAGALLALAAALGAPGCGPTAYVPPATGGPVDFVLGGMSFHLSSGVYRAPNGVLTLYLSNQPDTCQAIIFMPRDAMILTLQVAPASDGTTKATFVPPPLPAPGPGQATAALLRIVNGQPAAQLDGSDGSIAWTPQPGGAVTIDDIDLGFAGTPDRLVTYGLTLPPC